MDNNSDERRMVAIRANPISGPRSRREHLEELAAALQAAGLETETFMDRDAYCAAVGDPERCHRYRCQIAAAGDGTVNSIVNTQPALPLAVFPLGGENLLARHLGYKLDPLLTTRAVAAAHITYLDLGRAADRNFVLMASVGFDADVVHRLHAHRAGHMNLKHYIRHSTASLRAYAYPRLQVDIADDGTQIDAAHVFVFNLPEYAWRLPFSPASSGADGWLELVAFKRPGSWQALRYLFAVWRGKHRALQDVVHRRVRRVHIESSSPAPIQMDGDPAGFTPVTIDVASTRLAVVEPT